MEIQCLQWVGKKFCRWQDLSPNSNLKELFLDSEEQNITYLIRIAKTTELEKELDLVLKENKVLRYKMRKMQNEKTETKISTRRNTYEEIVSSNKYLIIASKNEKGLNKVEGNLLNKVDKVDITIGKKKRKKDCC